MNDINESLSIVILNYKNYEMTIKCVDKLIENKFKFNIVIVDNNSKNGSFEKLNKEYRNITNIVVLSSNNNKGYAAGNNIGIRYIKENIKSEYVCIMNPDIIIEDKHLFYNLINKIERHNLQGITGLQITNNVFDSTTLGWKLPTFSKIIILNSKFISKLLKPVNYSHYEVESKEDSLAIVDVMPGCFFIMDMNIFETIGYFDENTFLYYEENILSHKAKKIDCKFGVSLNDIYIHDHKEKDESLLNLNNKYKDRKILLNSQGVYVKNHLSVKGLKLFIYYLSVFYNLYIELPLIHIAKLLKSKIKGGV
ncbi:MAG: glycosyltransferase family 2 protein [Clostridium sp.]|nr:glycosyltransferase family 2 protein [Clostridium sp.]